MTDADSQSEPISGVRVQPTTTSPGSDSTTTSVIQQRAQTAAILQPQPTMPVSHLERSRLDRPALRGVRIQSAAVVTIIVIAIFALTGQWWYPLAFFAVGAGAGYSLSGSV